MTVTKKQTSLAVFAVIFATAMIAGTLASATSDNMAFAGGNNRHHHGHHWNNHHHSSSSGHDDSQKISQSNSNHQESKCVSSGGVSVANGGLVGVSLGGTGGSIRNSCNNDSTQTNANSGNNVK
jgi:hypothetical protein